MKKIRLILILTICLLSFRALAQPVETLYQGTVVVSGTKNNLPLADDGPFNIGFSFTFYGNVYTQFSVSENGMLMFTDPSAFYSGEAAQIPLADLPNNYIAAFWDNLTVQSTGNILYSTIGSAPNRKLIVQFKNHNLYNPPSYMGTFAIILYEGSNIIQTQYRQIVNNSSDAAHGSSALLGIENADGTAGVQYAYHSNTAAQTGKVITYTPDGSGGYTVKTSDPYNFIYLTSNLSAPEPGITTLLSPPQDGVIGSDYTFTWSDAGNVTQYQLLISDSPDLGGAAIYPAGTNLSYNVTGLTIGATYYWGVFASNATGTTWCEIKRFTIASAPPLAAVAQTIWVEQNQDKTILLAYTGGDASPKTAKITSLPAQGKLYQYNAGVKGAEITAPLPVTVTDAARNVIYSASGNTGNGAGNFNYVMNDAGGDSPAALITINVSPPGIPNVLYIAKSPAYVEIQFDIPMADPTGKEGQFTVTANGSPVALTSASFKPGDNKTYLLNTSAALTEPVLVSYTPGTVTAVAGGVLLAFTSQPATLTAQTITWTQSLDLKYNQSPFTLASTVTSGPTVTYSSSNLAVATISGSTLTILALGTAEITARKVGDATYAPVQYIRTLTASKGDQVITFTVPSKTYGAADFTVSATTPSGLPITFSGDNPAVATVTGNLVHIVSAGSVVITASQAGNTLWNSATDPQTLTVSKATLTVTADPKTRAYNVANPALTFTYSGWVLGVETIDTPPTASTTVTITSAPAVYTGAITLSGGLDNNYLFTFLPADFTVIKADQAITFPPLANGEVGQPDYSPGATTTSGLAVSYSSDNLAVATITAGQLIHIVAKGTALITAGQPGDANYNPAPPFPRTLVVDKAVAVVDYSNSTGSAYSWYNTGTLYIKCPADMPQTDGKLTIYDMNGRPVLIDKLISIIPGETVQTQVTLQGGIYVSRIKAGDRDYAVKVVVK